MTLILLLLLLLLSLAGAYPQAEVQTECGEQLYFFYQQQGLNTTLHPLIQPITFTSSGSCVTATMAWQNTAESYQTELGQPAQARVSYGSFDVPWCASNFSMQCNGQTLYGVGKIDNCLIVDWDQGGDTQVAGRIYFYILQNGTCASQPPSVTFCNVTLTNQTTANYIYSTVGLFPPYPYLSPEASLAFYQNSTCFYSDGAVADAQNQSQFVCVDQTIGCAHQRVNAEPSAPVVPVPQFQCIGAIPGYNSSGMVVSISSWDPPEGVSGTFQLVFCQNNDILCVTNFRLNLGAYPTYSLIAGTRRQFISPYNTFTQTVVIQSGGQVTTYTPVYWLAPQDPVASNIPCLCDFSVVCDANGTVLGDNVTVAMELDLNNVLPIPIPPPAKTVPAFDEMLLVLNASSSNDPDQRPSPLSLLWRVYSEPTTEEAQPPVVFLPSNRDAIVYLNTSQLLVGLYQFLLYGSDGQSVTFAVMNLTIVRNLLFPVINVPSEIEFTPYCGASPESEAACPEPGQSPEPVYVLHGNVSASTNPTIPISYNWTQTIGEPMPEEIFCVVTCVQNTAWFTNTTKMNSVAVFPSIGLYGVQLCLSDNVTQECASALFYVLPPYIQPEAPPSALPNFTQPPIRNFTPAPRPVINFTNATLNPTQEPGPVAPTPEVPTNVTPVFPVYPIGPNELLAMLIVLLAALFVLLLFLIMYILYEPADFYGYNDRIIYTVDSY